MWRLINLIRRNGKLFFLVKSLRSIGKNGFSKTFREIAVGFRGKHIPLGSFKLLTKNEKVSQSNTVFPRKHKISIIVSLYNTPKQYLLDMIESVLSQTYNNWELCLADGSLKDKIEVKHICNSYTQSDKRIKYRKFNKDLGISERLNKAIEMSSGDFLCILHQSDILHPSALYDVMNVICNEDADFIYSDEAYFNENNNVTLRHYKPDYAIDTLCSHNYIGHLTVFDKKLINKTGAFKSEYDGSQDYDLIFRLTDAASKIYHIQKILYFHRNDKKIISSDIRKKMENILTSEKIITEYLKKHDKPAQVVGKIELPGYYRVIYELKEKPVVSIIIPNKDNASLLRKCISSILAKTIYNNYEIIIVENNSTEDITFALYEELKRYNNIHIVHWKGKGFNFSEICNYGAKNSNGSQLIFLNNDVLIITPNWIEEMLMYSQREDVGAVGAKLYYLNGSVQHAGVILGLGDIGGHIFHGAPHDTIGYMGKLQIVQNLSIITAACLMIRKKIFGEVGCFATEFPTSYNDFDLCLRIRKAGFLIVWTPYAEAYHFESRSRGYNTSFKRKHRHAIETTLFKARWKNTLNAGDPYYNHNFSLNRTNYSYK
ncbi:MAG: glycosyltransferase family 2 protein [Treponema sp.]|nr:glycosyltransferase family 2 protein [Treponema sp.]